MNRNVIDLDRSTGAWGNNLVVKRLFWVCLFIVLATTSVHGLAFLAADIRPDTNTSAQAWGWILLYQFFFLFPLGLARYLMRTVDSRSLPESPLARFAERHAGVFLAIAVIGVVLHWDAKLTLLGDEQFTSLAQLRGAWLHQSASRSFGLVVESMSGHLLSSFSFAGIFFLATRSVSQGFSLKRLAYFIVFSVVGILYSLAIVSRSTQLVLLVVVFLGAVYPYIRGVISFGCCIKRGLPLIILFALSVGGLANFQFFQTMTTGQEGSCIAQRAVNYEAGFLKTLPFKRVVNPSSFQVFVRQAWPSGNSMLLYFNHAIANFSKVIASGQEGDHRLLRFVRGYLQKLGLVHEKTGPVVRVYGPGGLTLPGAAWHDYGSLGMLLTAFLQGCMMLCVAMFLRRQSTEVASLMIYVGLGITTALSCLFVGPSVVAFPFVLFSFLVYSLLAVPTLRQLSRFFTQSLARESES